MSSILNTAGHRKRVTAIHTNIRVHERSVAYYLTSINTTQKDLLISNFREPNTA